MIEGKVRFVAYYIATGELDSETVNGSTDIEILLDAAGAVPQLVDVEIEEPITRFPYVETHPRDLGPGR